MMVLIAVLALVADFTFLNNLVKNHPLQVQIAPYISKTIYKTMTLEYQSR